MNTNSLYQNVTRNQEASWNDARTFAGGASLSNEKNLSNFTEELVSHYAKYTCDQYELSLDMLPDFEKNELARLYLETMDRDTSECVHGTDFSINNEYTCAILNLLQDDCQQNRDALSTIVLKNILEYYAESLQELLVTACDNYLNNSMRDAGFTANHDLESGDVVWGKF